MNTLRQVLRFIVGLIVIGLVFAGLALALVWPSVFAWVFGQYPHDFARFGVVTAGAIALVVVAIAGAWRWLFPPTGGES